MPERLRALVLEDEWPARNYLVQLVERTGLAHVVAAVPSTALATEALGSSPHRIDVAFVDVHLASAHAKEQSGLTWIEQTVRTRGEAAPRFVLSTAHDEHALRAYDLGVVDYLLKPFTEARVKRSLDRLLAASSAHAPERVEDVRIAARDGRAIVFLRKDEAYAFEAEGRLCFVHSYRGRLDVDLSLTSLESVLGAGYLRVHRSWLVSLEHVRSIERDGGDAVLLVGPQEPPVRVQVARDRAAAVRDRLLSRAVGLRGDRG
jgi:DNA-binding LytR/AlgR family response regulator